MNKKQIKQVATVSGMAMLGIFVVSTIANRVPAVKQVRDKVFNGL